MVRGYVEGAIQIAMGYMDCGALGDLLQHLGPLPQECIGAVAKQALLALQYLKERHLIHRDLKPQNILLNTRGEVKVSAFGCVAELQDSFGKCGTFVGTVPYMSPERTKGEPYGLASDVWSFGLLALEGACGRYPYPAATYFDLVSHIVDGPPPTDDAAVRQLLSPALLLRLALTNTFAISELTADADDEEASGGGGGEWSAPTRRRTGGSCAS